MKIYPPDFPIYAKIVFALLGAAYASKLTTAVVEHMVYYGGN
jgi:hypothetical protein